MEPDILGRYIAGARQHAASDLTDISSLRIKIDVDDEGRYFATCAQADWLFVTGSSFRDTWYASMGSIMLVYDWVYGGDRS